MTFVVNAIKQEHETTNTYIFLLDVDSEQLWRDIIQQTWMILLSISKYNQDKTEFGTMYVKVLYEWVPYQIVSPSSFTLKDLCTFFIRCGMDVVDVNDFFDMQTDEQVTRIISLCKTTYITEIETARLEKIKAQEEDQKKKYYEDRLLKRSKVSITWILDKIETLLQTKRIHIPPKDQKWIDTQINEIKKQKMGSNYEKIKVLLQDLFVFLYSVEDAHYSSIQENWETLFSGTTVSIYDLQRQVEILEEVKYQSSFGWTVLWWRKEYDTFPILSYFLFLKKDILSLFDDLGFLAYKLYEYTLLFLSLILTSLSFILIINELLLLEINITSLCYSLISLWWFSFLFYIASLFKRENAFRFLAGLFVVVIVVYYFTLPIIEHSFALK